MPKPEIKTEDNIETKTFNARLEIKQTEEDDQYVFFEGYASTFDDVDAYNDIVVRGAFKDSLAEQMPKLLNQHMFSRPLGVIDEAYEDAKGLFVRGRMPKEHSEVKDLKALLDIGAIDSFSIGYSVNDQEWKDGIRLLKEVNLYEVSFVTLPANGNAKLTSVKSISDVKTEIKTQRDFEQALRESGAFSKDACTYLASFFDESKGEPSGESKQTSSSDEFTQSLNKLIGDLK